MRLAPLLAGGVLAWHAAEVGHSARSAWTTPQTMMIRDTAAFRAAWENLYTVPSQRPSRPAVDFSEVRVLFVASGTKMTGGYRLGLSAASVIRDTAVITITLFTPPSGCGVSQDLTSPAVAIALPVTPLPFRIISQERADSVRCN